MGELLHHLLERNALNDPQGEALVDPAVGVRWTWAELDRMATKSAHGLQAEGLGRGDRAVLIMPNRPEFAVGLFAVLKAGGVVVPVNPRFTARELAHIVKTSEAALVIHDPSLQQVVADSLSLAQSPARSLPAPRLLEPPAGAGGVLPADLTPADLAELIFTSGTTGAPKGAMLSHGAVAMAAAMFAAEMDIRLGDRVLSMMPLTHSAVLNLTFLGAAAAGATNVIGNYSPGGLPQIVQQERCTHFFGAPVAYFMSAKLPNLAEFDLSSMKRWAYGGAPTSREQVLAIRAKFGPNIACVYGLTEAGPNGTLLEPADQVEHAGSIGRRGTFNTEIRLVDEHGHDVAPGTVGEILLRTTSAMDGYWRNEAATGETIRDGWIWTGDMARRDEDGYIFIVDRKKDVVITGGVNVYPKEVEEVLNRHPAVEECAVFGVSHPEWGESVVVAYVARGGAEASEAALRDFCNEHLAGFKVPRAFHVVPALPRNSNGKVLKADLRQQFRS
ncbi:MAG TPA: AMP-binding protein [Symbiobacteriaceae bacterium]|jgi:long-chain acyl-CoA synthetase/feruloyl-CoA synthase